ncbi:hypothetical protein [Tissierella sp.]|nr:hypothetical protein [Tissierella sp.]MDR7856643.1 hypothetical protein [Tissierella sp.]
MKKILKENRISKDLIRKDIAESICITVNESYEALITTIEEKFLYYKRS